MEFTELIRIAQETVNPRQLSELASSGGVGCALESASGAVYRGVCIDTACSLGFCAEHAAAAAMVTAGEKIIRRVVAVNADGKVMPPCGRCREFLAQLAEENLDAEILVTTDTAVTLRSLLPYDWRETL